MLTNKITHADLRLENILVSIDGRAVLSNFSYAKRFKKKTMTTAYERVRGFASLFKQLPIP